MDLTDPVAVALEIAEVLRSEGIDHALYGGLLLAAYGRVREDGDADVAVVRSDPAATSALLSARLGLHCTVVFDRRRFGGLLVSRITLIDGEERNTLDLVEPTEPGSAMRALGRALCSQLRRREIRVLPPEDSVIFKVPSTRELDVEDAASVVRAQGAELDTGLVEREIEELSTRIGPGHPVRDRWTAVRGRR